VHCGSRWRPRQTKTGEQARVWKKIPSRPQSGSFNPICVVLFMQIKVYGEQWSSLAAAAACGFEPSDDDDDKWEILRKKNPTYRPSTWREFGTMNVLGGHGENNTEYKKHGSVLFFCDAHDRENWCVRIIRGGWWGEDRGVLSARIIYIA